MYIVYNYKCTNSECKLNELVEERMVRRSEIEDQRCLECHKALTRTFTAPIVPTHVSWSTWRV